MRPIFISLAIVLTTLLAEPSRAQVLDCNAISDFSKVAPFADDPAQSMCRIWSGSAYRVKVFYPADWGATPSVENESILDEIARAVRTSLDAYRHSGFLSVAEVRDVHVGYAPAQPAVRREQDAAAVTDGDGVGAPCQILVFGEATSETGLRQVVAHEMFHCVQLWAFPQRYTPAAYWWQEGSAEMASGLVYPTDNREHGFTVQYDQTHVLFDHKYGSALFFQSYANALGIPALISLLRQMPDTDDPTVQYAVLSGLDGFGEAFHGFGRSFMDRAIADPGGGMMAQAEPGAHETIVLNSSREFTMSATSFTLDAFFIRIPRERSAVLSNLAPAEDDVFVSYRVVGETGWSRAQPGATVEIAPECDHDVGVMVLVTSVRNSPEFIDIDASANIKEQPCETCACARPIPACVAGSWRMDDMSQWDPYWARISSMTPSTTYSQQEGTIEITIDRTGRFYEGFMTKGTGVAHFGPETLTITATLNGVGAGTMCINDGGDICRLYSSNSIMRTMEIDPPTPIIGRGYSGFVPGNTIAKHRYQCRGPDAVMFESVFPLEPPLAIEFEFRR